MKAFEKFNEPPKESEESYYSLKYPEDVNKICDYLNQNGKVNITSAAIARFYSDFSDELYAASWMEISDQILEEFANYLSEQDI